MNFDVFLMLLWLFSIATACITQRLKKRFKTAEKNYSSNVIALVVAVVVGSLGMTLFYFATDTPFTALNVVLIVIMILSNCIAAMIGYDKAKQTALQIKTAAIQIKDSLVKGDAKNGK